MISMNMRPPRATAARKVESEPKVKARIRKSESLNIGSGAGLSIETIAMREAIEGGRGGEEEKARGAPPAGGRVTVGPDPVGDRDHHQDQAEGEGDVSEPVDRLLLRHASLLELEIGPHRAEEPDRDRDQEDEPPVDR